MSTSQFNYENALNNLQLKINYSFQNIKLLTQAFIHKSASKTTNYGLHAIGVFKESTNQNNYDILKLIGENVINLIVISNLSKQFINETPYDINERKNELINTTTLTRMSYLIGLNELLISENEIDRNNPKILSDIFYSLIGAIFTDSDYHYAKNSFDITMQLLKESNIPKQLNGPQYYSGMLLTPSNIIKKTKTDNNQTTTSINYKGLLQDYCLKSKYPIPIYKLINSEGPPHHPIYECRVSIGPFNNKFVNCDGEPASTVKQADQNAAKKLYEQFQKDPEYIKLYLTLSSFANNE